MRCRLILWALIAAMLAGSTPASASASFALVLAVDVSNSVSTDRYLLQHDGIARAFETPELVTKIAATGGIWVLVLEWSDPDKIAVTVDWTGVNDRATAAAFAAKVRKTQRSSHGLTAIGAALQAAAATFDRLPRMQHKVIDVSGDGMSNFGPSPGEVRDRLVAQGVTINGLAILTEEPWLAEYYRDNVVGGTAGFCLVAEDMDSFADAILKKLVQEVASSGTIPERTGTDRSTARMAEKWVPAFAGTTLPNPP